MEIYKRDISHKGTKKQREESKRAQEHSVFASLCDIFLKTSHKGTKKQREESKRAQEHSVFASLCAEAGKLL